MKQILICGNLGANAVRRTSSDGRELMTFSVAVNDAKNNVTWFNCVCGVKRNFDYLVKGQAVVVVGDLQPTLYNNNIDLTVYADRIELCGKASSAPAEETHNE